MINFMSDLSAVAISPGLLDAKSDTFVLNCEALELRSEKLVLKLTDDKLKEFKVIIINGRKYKLEEDNEETKN